MFINPPIYPLDSMWFKTPMYLYVCVSVWFDKLTPNALGEKLAKYSQDRYKKNKVGSPAPPGNSIS